MGPHSVHLVLEELLTVDCGRDELVVDGEREVVGVHRREPGVLSGSAKSFDAGSDERLRERDPVDLRDLPSVAKIGAERRRRREDRGVHRHSMGLDVIGVAITAEVVVRDEHLRAHLANHRHKIGRGGEKVSAPEAGGVIVVRGADHPGVAVLARMSEESVVGHTEGVHRAGKFDLPMLAESVLEMGRAVGVIVKDDLTLFAQGARDERDVGTLGRVLGHGGAGADRFVVGVGVHEQETAFGRDDSHENEGSRRTGRLTDMSQESYPRQSARTRRFTAGAPRLFTVSADGSRVLFVRSNSGTDPVGRLWALEVATGSERLLSDPHALHLGSEDLSPAERARRERMREGGSGIVGYATDTAVSRAVFALSGDLYCVDVDGASPTRALDVPGPVIDPRLSPDGRHIAYVSGRSLRIVEADGTGDRLAAEPAHDLQTCGLVDFIGAEELSRTRGFWWAPGSDAVVIQHVDETPVQEWWIADPAHPDRRPVPHRYPAAGSANANLSLEIVRLDGTRTDVAWDSVEMPYLVDISWTNLGDPLIVVSSRDQRHQRILALDPRTGDTTVVTDLHDEAWLDATPGAFRWAPNGQLLTLRADRESDTYRLHLGAEWLTTPGVQVRGILDVDASGVLVAIAPDPTTSRLLHVAWDGTSATVGADTGWTVGRTSSGTHVSVERTLGSTLINYSVVASGARHAIVSNAEIPCVTPIVTILEAGPLRIRTAVLFPTGHVPGSRGLPVLMSPYGGPHHQEVVAAGGTYGEAQWLADQGFCVVVADGRGTPGRGPAWEREVLGDLATGVLEDQVTALHAVVAQWPHDVDPTRVGIRGWSFGGYLAALAVLRRPDIFHAAVAGAPVTEWRLYDTAYTERYLGDPTMDALPYEACSLIPQAASLTRPLLLIHGLTDDNVVVAHTLALSAALTAAGRPHQVLPLSGVTHMTPQAEVAENKLLLELHFLRLSLNV